MGTKGLGTWVCPTASVAIKPLWQKLGRDVVLEQHISISTYLYIPITHRYKQIRRYWTNFPLCENGLIFHCIFHSLIQLLEENLFIKKIQLFEENFKKVTGSKISIICKISTRLKFEAQCRE